MEHVLFLEDKQLRKDFLDRSEYRIDICPGLSAIARRDVFELLVSQLFMMNPPLTSGPVLAHLMWACVSQDVMSARLRYPDLYRYCIRMQYVDGFTVYSLVGTYVTKLYAQQIRW